MYHVPHPTNSPLRHNIAPLRLPKPIPFHPIFRKPSPEQIAYRPSSSIPTDLRHPTHPTLTTRFLDGPCNASSPGPSPPVCRRRRSRTGVARGDGGGGGIRRFSSLPFFPQQLTNLLHNQVHYTILHKHIHTTAGFFRRLLPHTPPPLQYTSHSTPVAHHRPTSVCSAC